MSEEKPKHELVLFDIVSMDFVWDNTYAMGGLRPNAKHIASQYGCQLEVRDAQYEQKGYISLSPRVRRNMGIDDDGNTQSAVLIGEDREKLAKARQDIWQTNGVSPLEYGSVTISRG